MRWWKEFWMGNKEDDKESITKAYVASLLPLQMKMEETHFILYMAQWIFFDV